MSAIGIVFELIKTTWRSYYFTAAPKEENPPVMNIYYIEWTHEGRFDYRAVVIAPREHEALQKLHMDESFDDHIKVTLIGTCTPGKKMLCNVICRESL